MPFGDSAHTFLTSHCPMKTREAMFMRMWSRPTWKKGEVMIRYHCQNTRRTGGYHACAPAGGKATVGGGSTTTVSTAAAAATITILTRCYCCCFCYDDDYYHQKMTSPRFVYLMRIDDTGGTDGVAVNIPA